MSTNVCTFVGRLGNNPEITTMPSGKERVRFSIAVDRNYKREDGTRPTDWIPVVIWGSANYVRKVHLGKGDKVCVTGSWEINEWTDKDGIVRSLGALKCTGIELAAHRQSEKEKAAQEGAAATNPEFNTAVDDDLPF
jgi:single-strand DNA-binding protein